MNRRSVLLLPLAALALTAGNCAKPQAGPGSSGPNKTGKETLKVGFLPVT
jgi:hypothetical protein